MEIGGYLVHECGDRRKVIKIENGYVYTESHGVTGVMSLRFYLEARQWNYIGEDEYEQRD